MTNIKKTAKARHKIKTNAKLGKCQLHNTMTFAESATSVRKLNM